MPESRGAEVSGVAASLDGVRNGRCSARDLAQRCITRIHAHEAAVRAFVALDEHRALSMAAACDESGSGPLRGLPVGVKDIFDTSDLHTRYGSPIYEAHRPNHNASVVDALIAAGAYVFGKTVTTEFAHMHPGVTRNPWNLAHTPGGSSSGSAAAVAAGFVPAAIGSQTNGSVIRPAAFCGIVGFKPTFGLIPFAGGLHFAKTLDHVGLMARSVDDVGLVSAALLGGAAGGWETGQAAAPRIGFLASVPWKAPLDDASAALRQALGRLRDAGASVGDFALPESCAQANVVHRTITLFEGARRHSAIQSAHRVLISETLNADLDAGRTITPHFYRDALERRSGIAARARDWFEKFDVIVCLPASGAAPARLDITGDPSYCTFWSLTGFPAITIPIGVSTGGLPFGMQLAAAPGQDAALLRVARWCENVIEFSAVPPLGRG